LPVLLAVLVLLLAGGGVLAWVLTQDDETPSSTATDNPTDNPTDEPSESASSGSNGVPSNTVLVPIKRDDSSKIYAVDPDNPDTLAPITPGDSDNFPAISPDRETIVYLARATDDAVWPIVLDAVTGESHQFFDNEDACDYARRPAFSPDGQRLALNCIDANGNSTGMYIVDPEGGLEQTIDVEGVVRGTPTWVSQTQLVASVADSEDGASTLWLYDIQSKEVEQLTSGEGWDTHPDWVAGPDRLLFVRSESNEPTGELWTLTLDGEAEQIDVGQPVLDPVWSPGGTEIAFVTEDDMLATLVVDDPSSVEVVPGTEDVSGPPVWGDR
jgi:Tol biopolymer transport system component